MQDMRNAGCWLFFFYLAGVESKCGRTFVNVASILTAIYAVKGERRVYKKI